MRDDHTLARLVTIFQRQQSPFGQTQCPHDTGDSKQRPYNDMQPERGPDRKFHRQRQNKHQRADDHRQESSRTIADVETFIIKTAGTACRGKTNGGLE